MNERIRQLAEQAWDSLVDEMGDAMYENRDREAGELSVPFLHAYDQKFAELIVKECLEQIDKIRDGCDSDNEDKQALGADWAGLAVARHFGVE